VGENNAANQLYLTDALVLDKTNQICVSTEQQVHPCQHTVYVGLTLSQTSSRMTAEMRNVR
jgi:hypothetical protein